MLKKLDNIDCKARIHSSKVLTIVTLSIYSLAVISVLLVTSDHPMFIIFIPFILIHAIKTIRKNCLVNTSDAIVYFHQVSKEKWHLRTRAGKTLVCRQCSWVFRSNIFVLISFQSITNRRRIKLLVAFDAIPQDRYTHLVSNLWKGAT